MGPSRASRLLSAAGCWLLATGLLAGCSLFGSKGDPTTDEIFEQGQVDPTLPSDVGYVPLNPFYTTGLMGPLQAPTDVYVGYDELVYVGDQNGLHVLDLAGRPQAFVGEMGGQALRGITAIVQDRRLDLYVAARRTIETGINPATDSNFVDFARFPLYGNENASQCEGRPTGPRNATSGGDGCWDLPVIYHITGLTTGQPRVVDVIWHPFDDGSRRFTRFERPGVFGSFSDEDARFTGVATLADNTLYATRSGPVNATASGRPNQTFSPFNAFLIFTATGDYVQYVRALTPDRGSLLSAYWPSDVATFVGPPQRAQVDNSPDFFLAQAPPPGQAGTTYGVLSVRIVQTSDGVEYQVDSQRLAAASTTPQAGDGALFEARQFPNPTSLAVAPDQTGYLFVLDGAKDSLFVFNRLGIEGVAPPPGAGTTRPVKASFGGSGSGPLQFSNPQGVAYFRRVVYVADTGNNRISRYRLNTDFE